MSKFPLWILLACVGCSAASDSTDASSDDALVTFDQFEQHNLDVVNSYRATKGIAPLTLASSLTKFAIAGSKELETNHLPHQHFIDAVNDGTIWSDGFKTMAAENQGDPNGWPELVQGNATKNELAQIDAIEKAMFDEGPGSGEAHGHYTNMMNAKYHRFGVGLVRATGGKLYLTNDFSD